tara:strand:+ start:879 stop:2789 length:1911 start_codon:yes stop_codon:yes gene_type:complete
MAKHDLRRSQIVVPFGPGAIYNYKNYSAITMIVDEWNIKDDMKAALEIDNERLVNYINFKLKHLEGAGSKKIRFLCSPPIAQQKFPTEAQNKITSPYIGSKFPEWGVCSRCKGLSKFDSTFKDEKKCNNNIVPHRLKGQPSCNSLRSKAGKIEPARFVCYCINGHIQDFPYGEYMSSSCQDNCKLHESVHSSGAPSLYLSDDTRGFGFTSLRISCGLCDKSVNLKGVNIEKNRIKKLNNYGQKVFKCSGCRPWTSEENESCSEILDITPRASSKLYMPLQQTAIYVPEAKEVRDPFLYSDLADGWITDNVDIIVIENTLKGLPKSLKANLSDEDILSLIVEERKRSDMADQENQQNPDKLDNSFFKKEYETLTRNKVDDDRFVSSIEDISQYSDAIKSKISSLHSIKKLTSTTALMGFVRKAGSKKANVFNASRINADFMPAYEVVGEGIFIDFGIDKIINWKEANRGFTQKQDQLRSNASKDFYEYRDDNFNYGFILIHTLSHMLMRQLELQCGYSLTELKERIYFNEDEEMAGLLIYTASSDSQGSLGGLVRMIKPAFFENLIQNAIENAYTCFNDPVCIESIGQGHSGLCLAGCHACSMITDLACDTLPKNIFLDRNALIGKDNDAKGYFSDF